MSNNVLEVPWRKGNDNVLEVPWRKGNDNVWEVSWCNGNDNDSTDATNRFIVPTYDLAWAAVEKLKSSKPGWTQCDCDKSEHSEHLFSYELFHEDGSTISICLIPFYELFGDIPN